MNTVTIPRRTYAGGNGGPRLLILGGVHGDEYEPIAAIQRLMFEIRHAQLFGEVTLIPIVNRPAFAAMSRVGPDGLDLARTCPGRADGSITEQIAFEISELIRQSDYLIDLHTGGLAAKITPLCGYMLHDDLDVRRRQHQLAHAFNLPIVWGTNPKFEGRTLSVARDAGIPAIYAEWGGGGGCETTGRDDYVQGCLNVMRCLEMLERAVPESRVQYFVEDFRDESGYLQKNYPAEIPGYFEAKCRLHDHVNVGDVAGWIHPHDLTEPLPVTFRQQGMVILLRAIPAVKPGDFLATVLEIDRPGKVRHE